MAINEWWAGDPTERYWLEITDRQHLGRDLHAPKEAKNGRQTPGYALIEHVRDGDIVLHYWKQAGQEKAIVGYSQATGSLETARIRWQSHGTYGRRAAEPEEQPAWRFPLANFTDLRNPVTLEKLRQLEGQLQKLSDQLAGKYGTGESLYLPFAFSDKRPLRTSQSYLAKFPASFISAIPGLEQVHEHPFTSTERHSGVPTRSITGGTGYQADPKVRRALERHAVERALKYFVRLGYKVNDVGAHKPYDIHALDAKKSELHVEVKGSAGTSTTVELTAGEVNEATTGRKAASVLFVVDQIVWTKNQTGSIETSGGRARVWWNWKPEEQRLTPTSFRYLLPRGDQDDRL